MNAAYWQKQLKREIMEYTACVPHCHSESGEDNKR